MSTLPQNGVRGRLIRDAAARRLFGLVTLAGSLLVVLMAAGLYIRSRPVLEGRSIVSLLFSMNWRPMRGAFGLMPFIAGTVSVTLLAVVIAVPVSILVAIYLAEYAPRVVRSAVLPMMDVLSGIPSVVYGVWGVLVIVPAVAHAARWFGVYSSGYSLLAGGLVLAVMICPFIVHVAREVLQSVPDGMREAALSLGATRWQTARGVVFRKALPGIVAAVMLGLARALGETIAVLMVVGNVPMIPRSLFDPAYPLPALLANNYGEMMSVPLYDAALLFAALVLLVVVVFFSLLARLALHAVRGVAA